MVEVGLPIDYIDTQDVTITNTTDSLTYKQATNVRFFIEAKLTRRQRTDDIFENLWDLVTPAIEADIMVTQPEIAALVTLMVQTNNDHEMHIFYHAEKTTCSADINRHSRIFFTRTTINTFQMAIVAYNKFIF